MLLHRIRKGGEKRVLETINETPRSETRAKNLENKCRFFETSEAVREWKLLFPRPVLKRGSPTQGRRVKSVIKAVRLALTALTAVAVWST